MFQSFKKWVKNEDIQQQQSLSPPSGMQLMKGDLQRKFAKGVQYNMKIVIRGDRNTGKTCLLQRLKGSKFVEEYIPTAEIQVASIHWDYKATDDIVKVDVWDIVDQGKSKKKEAKGLKIVAEKSSNDILEQPVLDASFLDVYKQAHAVIMMFDVTKKWTFSYIERELPKVPKHIPVLVLANFRDMGGHRVISVDEVEALIESVDRPRGSPSVMFYESSMKNGFGLKYVHKFFNMPFLLVQRESLLKQLETNHLDLESCMEELSTEEHGYDEFMQRVHDARSKGQTRLQPTSEATTPSTSEKQAETTSDQLPMPKTAARPASLEMQSKTVIEEKSPQGKNGSLSPAGKGNLFSPSLMEDQTPTVSNAEPEKRGFMSRFFKRSSNEPNSSSPKEQAPQQIKIPQDAKPVANVDEFVPDDAPVNGFLDDIPDARERAVTSTLESSDDDENAGNPMVTGFQEELDSDDDFRPSYKGASYSLSDSEPEIAKPQRKPIAKEETKAKPAQITKAKDTSPAFLPHSRPPTSGTHELLSDSDEDDMARPEITQDVDLSSDDGDKFFESKTDFAVMAKKSKGETTLRGDQTVVADVIMSESVTEPSVIPKEKVLQEVSDESDDDAGPNAMVSKGFDDISSNDESTPQPPVAIVTPVQAERTASVEEDETGLNLEFSMSDLNFLEQSSKQPNVEDLRRSSKDSSCKSHRSKKSSSRRSEEEGTKKSHKKHKKHRSKDGEEREHAKTEGSRSKHSRDDKERKKKRKSKDAEKPAKAENADDDLEAFLSGM